MKKISFVGVLLVLFSNSACTLPVSHQKALVKDGENVRIINVNTSPGTLVGTISIPGLIKLVSVPGARTAFAINTDNVYVIDTLAGITRDTIAAPESYAIRDIYIPANKVPHVLLDHTLETFVGYRYERITTLARSGRYWDWDWDVTNEFNQMLLVDNVQTDRLIVSADGSQAVVLGKVVSTALTFHNVALSGPYPPAFQYASWTVSTGLTGYDLALSFDESFAYVVHDLGLSVFSTGMTAGFVRWYTAPEIDLSKWGTGTRKLGVSSSDEYLYLTTEGLAGLFLGGGFAINATKLRVGDDLDEEGDVTQVADIPLPPDYAWLSDLYGYTLSFKDIAVIGNTAHFVLTALVSVDPLPRGLHLVIVGASTRGLSLLDSTTLSTPESIAISNAGNLFVTNSDGGYLNHIIAEPLIGFLPGTVLQLAASDLSTPSTLVLSNW